MYELFYTYELNHELSTKYDCRTSLIAGSQSSSLRYQSQGAKPPVVFSECSSQALFVSVYCLFNYTYLHNQPSVILCN